MYRSKVCVQKFWYCLPSLDIRPELSEIDNSAPKKLVAGCETRKVISRVIYSFFSTNEYGPIAEWLRPVIDSMLAYGFGLRMMLNPSAAQLPFCLALSPSVHRHARFLYFCSLYNFSFLDFVSGDLALTGF